MASAAAKTIARYQHDAALRELATSVVSWHPLSTLGEAERALFKTVLDSSDGALATKETIFHPQGGGQPSDRGTITVAEGPTPRLQLDVQLVRKLPSGLILHAGSTSRAGAEETAPPPPPEAAVVVAFHPAQPVVQQIDSAARDHHSRLHTAGHLIGLAVRELERAGAFGTTGTITELRANHAPGTAWVEFGGSIAGEVAPAVQAAVDRMVAADLPVAVRWWDAAEVRERCSAGLDGVAALPEGEDLFRVVEVVGRGAYPCGGTHLPTTGEVGKVVIRKISRAKGKSKISYDVVPGKSE